MRVWSGTPHGTRGEVGCGSRIVTHIALNGEKCCIVNYRSTEATYTLACNVQGEACPLSLLGEAGRDKSSKVIRRRVESSDKIRLCHKFTINPRRTHLKVRAVDYKYNSSMRRYTS